MLLIFKKSFGVVGYDDKIACGCVMGLGSGLSIARVGAYIINDVFTRVCTRIISLLVVSIVIRVVVVFVSRWCLDIF